VSLVEVVLVAGEGLIEVAGAFCWVGMLI